MTAEAVDMPVSDSTASRGLSWAGFCLLAALLAFVLVFYGLNIVRWRDYPDLGFSLRAATGLHIVGVVREQGERAGIRVGDRILDVNHRPYATIEELRRHIHWEPGAVNLWHVERGGRTFYVSIANTPSGLKRALTISGLPFLMGLCYALIGVLVFLMKPHHRSSWVFLLFSFTFGLLLVYLNPLGKISPAWLENPNIYAFCFTPAVFVHLALCFPQERVVVRRWPWTQAAPYLLSAALFVAVRQVTGVMAYAPKPLQLAVVVYMVVGVVFFIGSCLQLRAVSASQIVRLRARMILLGFGISASLPLVDFAANALFKVYLLPSFSYYLPFFVAFPAFVGYSIVKHNLFDIDAIIKRTYGYVLTTGLLAGLYGLMAVGGNLAFGGAGAGRSPGFALVFILALVFLFNPIRDRAQRFIDRVFYRLEYDYQATVEKISESMRSLLDLEAIGRHMMATVRETLFVDRGYVLLLSADKAAYECLAEAGEPGAGGNPAPAAGGAECGPELAGLGLPASEPLVGAMAQAGKELTVYDIQEDPRFAAHRAACRRSFERLGATVLVPLIYERRLSGILALGRKKSGKFYRREDINLLKVLANQAAVAIENARNVERIVEKERLRVRIMDAFGKYVTREVRDQILEGRIPLDGESKEVTLLFADLRDFTTLAESTPPKAVVRIINGYFSEMAEAIGGNRGLILQFVGDEIEAVFGAPAELADHPTWAVRAAVEMRRRLAVVNRRLAEQGFGPLRHGIGVHTGTVVAANIGSQDRLSYAMVGDTVNLASRIQDLNKRFGTDVLLSATTAGRLRAEFAMEKLPATTVKGKKEPVEVYRLL